MISNFIVFLFPTRVISGVGAFPIPTDFFFGRIESEREVWRRKDTRREDADACSTSPEPSPANGDWSPEPRSLCMIIGTPNLALSSFIKARF